MQRKDFFRKSLAGLGGIVALPTVLGFGTSLPGTGACDTSPRETRGPFPNKTPAELLRANITGDRTGIPLLVNLEITDASRDCQPVAGALVDIWHCDSQGRYSEYGDSWQQREDLTGAHFLRGRQATDAGGRVSFISIFPGYYRGRAPHIHLEILDGSGTSLLVTQIAFPASDCDTVYAYKGYQGPGYVPNEQDGVFRDSLSRNMADLLRGNPEDGYSMQKRIVVPVAT